MANKVYKVGSEIYDIPNTESGAFLKDFPNAIEVESFILGTDTFDIPITERDAFLKDNPTAKPVKKKELTFLDVLATSSGKEPLTSLLQSSTPSVAQPQLPSQQQIKDKGSYAGDILERIGAGILDLATSAPARAKFAKKLIGVPKDIAKKELGLLGLSDETAEKIADNIPFLKNPSIEMGVGISSAVWDKIKDTEGFKDIEGKAQELRESSARYDKVFSEYLKNKEFGKALGTAVLSGAESLPMTMIAAFGGGVGLADMGYYAASKQYDQLSANQDMNEVQKISNALANGALEILTEKLGSANYGALIKKLYKTTGKEVAEQAVKTGIKTWLAPFWKKFGIYTAPIGEALEEGVNQFASNITARVTGEDKDIPLDYGVLDAMGGGFGGGAFFIAPGVLAQARGKYYESKVKEREKLAKEQAKEKGETTDKGKTPTEIGFLEVPEEVRKQFEQDNLGLSEAELKEMSQANPQDLLTKQQEGTKDAEGIGTQNQKIAEQGTSELVGQKTDISGVRNDEQIGIIGQQEEKIIENIFNSRKEFLSLQEKETNETERKDKGTDIAGGLQESELRRTDIAGLVSEQSRYDIGTGKGIIGNTSVKDYSLSDKEVNDLRSSMPNAKSDVSFSETNDANLFYNAISESKTRNKFSASVWVYPVKDYQPARKFLTQDGKAGLAITPEGDIISVFSHGEGKGRVAQLMINAIKEGGITLDNYEGLVEYYAKYGFVPVAKVKWNDSKAPEDWDKNIYKSYKDGKPDVVAMVYHGGDPNTLSQRIGKFGSAKDMLDAIPYVNEWEEAKAIQKKYVDRLSQQEAISVQKPVESTKLEHKANIEQQFRDEFGKKGVPQEQIDGALALLNARANSWASEQEGRTPEQYYQRIVGVKGGETTEATTPKLYQLPDGRQVMGMAMPEVTNGFYSPIEKKLSPEVRQIFDRLLTPKEASTQTQEKSDSNIPPTGESGAKVVKTGNADVKPLGAQENALIQSETEQQQILTDIIDENKEFYNVLHGEQVVKDANKFIEEKGIDGAAIDLMNPTQNLLRDYPTRQVARMVLIDHFTRVLGDSNATKADKDKAYNIVNKLQDILSKEANRTGQGNAHLNLWKVMQPAGLLEFTKRKISDFNNKKLNKKYRKTDKTIGQLIDALYENISEANKQIIDDILEGKTIESKIPKESATVPRKPAKVKTVAKEKIQEERNYRKNLLDNYRKNNKGSITLSANLPLTTEQIELGGNLIASYVREGYYRAVDIIDKLKKDFASIGIKVTDDKDLDSILQGEKEKGKTYRDWITEQEAKVGLGEEIKSLKIKIADIVKMHWTQREELGRTLAQKLIDDAGLTSAEANALEKAILSEYNKMIRERLDSFKDLSDILGKQKIPSGEKGKTLLDKFFELTNLGALEEPMFRQLFAEKFGFAPDITEEQGKVIMQKASVVQQMSGKGWFYRDAVIDLAKYLNEITPQSAFNELAETWIALAYANMLSGIPTSLLNLWSSGSNIAMKPLRNTTNLSKYLRAIKGRIKEGTPMSGELYNPIGDMYFIPLLQGIAHGAKEAAEIYVNGDIGSKYVEEITKDGQFKVSQLNRNKYGVGKRFKPINIKVGDKVKDLNIFNLAKYIGRNLSAQDRLMFNTAFDIEIAEMIRRNLVNKNLKGKALTKAVMDVYRGTRVDMEVLNNQIEDEAKKYKELTGKDTNKRQKAIRRRELLLKEMPITEEQKAEAEKLAQSNIFTDERGGLVATMAYAIGRMANRSPLVGTITKPFIPFTKIVGNVVEYMLDYTPVYGLFRANGWSITGITKRVTGHEHATAQMGQVGDNAYYEQMGRAWLGTISFLTLAALFLGNDDDDDIQISGGYNQEGFKKGGRENVMPKYSIRIKGVDISYLNIPSLAIPLGLIGNINDALKMNIPTEEIEERFAVTTLLDAVKETVFMVKDMSFVTGVQNLITMLGDISSLEESNWKRAGNTIAKTYIGFGLRPLPWNSAIVQQTWKFFDPTSYSQKDIKSVLSYAAGLQHFVNYPSMDQIGDKVKTYPGETLMPYTHWFNIKGDDPRWRFLADNNAIPTKIQNAKTYIDTKDAIETRLLEEDEYYNYTKTSGKLFSDKLVAYMADSAKVSKRLTDQVIENYRGESVIFTGVQKDVSDMWEESTKDARNILFSWYDFKESNPNDWNLMVKTGALKEPEKARIKIKVNDEDVMLTENQLKEYNQLMMQYYHTYIIGYLKNTEAVTADQAINPDSGKSYFQEEIDKAWSDARADAKADMEVELMTQK